MSVPTDATEATDANDAGAPGGGLDLDFDHAQQAIADAVAHFCHERAPKERVRALREGDGFCPDLWRELAALGVLAAATPHGEGGALELVAALEPLGRAAFPGPLVQTLLAAQVLEGEERAAVVEGRRIVAAGEGELLAWAPVADVFLVLESDAVRRAEPRGGWEVTASLAGEPWGRASLARGPALPGGPRAMGVFDLVVATLLAAGGRRLVEDAAEHARTRRQFGRAIGEFQAVAHPLADALMQLDASALLARAAAGQLDASGFLASGHLASRHPAGREEPVCAAEARSWATAARLSAIRSGTDAVHAAHQVFGAIGITLEGPAFFVSRWLRGLASLEPRPALLSGSPAEIRAERS